MLENYTFLLGRRLMIKSEQRKYRRILKKILKDQIAEGVKIFCNAAALGFETLAAQTVIRLRRRRKYRHIQFCLLDFGHEQGLPWIVKTKEAYKKNPPGGGLDPSGPRRRGRMRYTALRAGIKKCRYKYLLPMFGSFCCGRFILYGGAGTASGTKSSYHWESTKKLCCYVRKKTPEYAKIYRTILGRRRI